MGKLFVLWLSKILLFVGSFITIQGAGVYNKEGDGPFLSAGVGFRTGGGGGDPNSISYDTEQLLNRFSPLEISPNINREDGGFFYRPSYIKRADKGILLDVGDFVVNGASHAGGGSGLDKGESASKSFLLKNPSILRVGGMMRNSG